MDELNGYTAADLGGEPDQPGRPADIAALMNLWRDRDVLYAQSTRVISDASVKSVRIGRCREANALTDPSQRARAWARANAWYPPQHGQGN